MSLSRPKVLDLDSPQLALTQCLFQKTALQHHLADLADFDMGCIACIVRTAVSLRSHEEVVVVEETRVFSLTRPSHYHYLLHLLPLLLTLLALLPCCLHYCWRFHCQRQFSYSSSCSPLPLSPSPCLSRLLSPAHALTSPPAAPFCCSLRSSLLHSSRCKAAARLSAGTCKATAPPSAT